MHATIKIDGLKSRVTLSLLAARYAAQLVEYKR
jgi:hypothetical protein